MSTDLTRRAVPAARRRTAPAPGSTPAVPPRRAGAPPGHPP